MEGTMRTDLCKTDLGRTRAGSQKHSSGREAKSAGRLWLHNWTWQTR